MPGARLALGSLGGTITMTAAPGASGVAPTLSAHDLLAAVPDAAGVADVETATLASAPGASLGFADVLAALVWAERKVAEGCAAVVLVQGTDTLEETSYLLDLHWARPEPIVVTGAMRPASAAGPDGPANLLAALVTAAAPASRSRGVLVVMDDVVHAAARVRKTHATATDAFRSPDLGPLGRVVEGTVAYACAPARRSSLPAPPVDASARVALVETCLGDDAGLLRLAANSGYDGLVVAAFGAGHVPAALVDVLEEAAAAMPVVFATRTGAGTTMTSTYAFPGSETDLRARGVTAAGWLDPRKARLLLWSLLGAGAGRDAIAEEFAERGRCPSG